MATRGAPKGNQNASNINKLWSETIRRAVMESDGKKLRRIADALVDKAMDGDIGAMREIGDRLDGKAQQQIEQHVTGNMTVNWPLPRGALDE